MSRYIDADVAINLAKEEIDSGTPNDIAWKLEALPIADVVERKRGEWIENGYQDYPCVCSVCGTPQDIIAKFLFSYCPNCGADMRGEKK